MGLLSVLAVGMLPVGVIMCWAGLGTLRERWHLRRRGVRVPAIAERWNSRAGSFGVYRFLDTGGRTRLANAERMRTIPAAEVEIVYDPVDMTVTRERFWLAEVLVAIASLVVGAAVTASGLATLVLAVVDFA